MNLLWFLALLVVAIDPNGVQEPTAAGDVTAFIRIVSLPPDGFHVRDEWAHGDAHGAFALPDGYTESSDPVLAQRGQTIYAVGRVMNRNPQDNSSMNPASIRVWQSLDGGASWPGTGVDAEPAGSPHTVDKPWIAVGPDGSVYVAWVRVDLTGGGRSQILLRRSRNGVVRSHLCCNRLMTWDDAVAIGPPGDVTAPQIVFDDRGFVYVVWTDFSAQELRIARPLASAQTVATFRRINANALAGGIRVLPLASAQFNAVTKEIVVVWSDGESDLGFHSDLRLARAAAGASMTFSLTPLDAINVPGTDQFTPALGIDDDGRLVLAYYDRASDATTDYQERLATLTPDGALLSSTPLGPPCRAAIVGEYQSLSRTAGGWRAAWACSDAILSQVSH